MAISSYTCSRLVVPRWGAVPPSGSRNQQKQMVKALQMVWWCRSSNMSGHLHHLQDSHHWEYWCCFVAVGARPLEHHCSYDSRRNSPHTSGMTPHAAFPNMTDCMLASILSSSHHTVFSCEKTVWCDNERFWSQFRSRMSKSQCLSTHG